MFFDELWGHGEFMLGGVMPGGPFIASLSTQTLANKDFAGQ